ncbi:general stress protein [Deinococcus irradiatisoli]|uniref:General stress protein n=1 Tax=Deinococcus irradiatisoli TaxID=2202254 RepID=A0A2Z3JLF7_9DEIO|nr:pyridoxamine 5'-phosphate oxidase family protein [Deinococcus irradiatisoli]AWN23719.1 general stress protein [Deinococcus irradiatisoli]
MTTSDQSQSQRQPTHEEGVKTIAPLIKGIKFAMMTFTTEAGHLHSQPMTTQEQEFDGDVWFIGSKESDLVHSLSKKPQVNLAYAESGKGYVSLYGDAELIEDAAKLDELWSDFYKAYFPQGKTDPNIQLIKVAAKGAHYWESDGKLKGLFHMAKAAVTGGQPNHGDSESVKL